jgi:hypothetical protein
LTLDHEFRFSPHRQPPPTTLIPPTSQRNSCIALHPIIIMPERVGVGSIQYKES